MCFYFKVTLMDMFFLSRHVLAVSFLFPFLFIFFILYTMSRGNFKCEHGSSCRILVWPGYQCCRGTNGGRGVRGRRKEEVVMALGIQAGPPHLICWYAQRFPRTPGVGRKELSPGSIPISSVLHKTDECVQFLIFH